MPNEAGVGPLIIDRHMTGRHPGKDRFQHPVGCLILKLTAHFRKRDDLVGALGKKAAYRAAFSWTDRVHAFVPVAKGRFHSENRRNLDLDMPDALKKILNLLTLVSQRGVVGHMLTGASAAAPGNRAERNLPVRGIIQPPVNFSIGKAAFCFDNSDERTLAGQQIRNENNDIIAAADSLGILPEGETGHLVDAVFFKHRNRVLQSSSVDKIILKKEYPEARIFPGESNQMVLIRLYSCRLNSRFCWRAMPMGR